MSIAALDAAPCRLGENVGTSFAQLKFFIPRPFPLISAITRLMRLNCSVGCGTKPPRRKCWNVVRPSEKILISRPFPLISAITRLIRLNCFGKAYPKTAGNMCFILVRRNPVCKAGNPSLPDACSQNRNAMISSEPQRITVVVGPPRRC